MVLKHQPVGSNTTKVFQDRGIELLIAGTEMNHTDDWGLNAPSFCLLLKTPLVDSGLNLLPYCTLQIFLEDTWIKAMSLYWVTYRQHFTSWILSTANMYLPAIAVSHWNPCDINRRPNGEDVFWGYKLLQHTIIFATVGNCVKLLMTTAERLCCGLKTSGSVWEGRALSPRNDQTPRSGPAPSRHGDRTSLLTVSGGEALVRLGWAIKSGKTPEKYVSLILAFVDSVSVSLTCIVHCCVFTVHVFGLCSDFFL